MKAKELSELMYSPCWIGTLLSYFISGAQKNNMEGVKLELIYLVVPLLNILILKDKLSKANVRTTIETLLSENKIKTSIIGVNLSVSKFRRYSNNGLIALSNSNAISVSDMVRMEKTVHYRNESNLGLKNIYKAAYNLGVVFSKEEPSDVFIQIGFK